jgi:hypothetical protein
LLLLLLALVQQVLLFLLPLPQLHWPELQRLSLHWYQQCLLPLSLLLQSVSQQQLAQLLLGRLPLPLRLMWSLPLHQQQVLVMRRRTVKLLARGKLWPAHQCFCTGPGAATQLVAQEIPWFHP